MVGKEQHKTHMSKKYKERNSHVYEMRDFLKALLFFKHTLARTISANVMRAIERVRESVCVWCLRVFVKVFE